MLDRIKLLIERLQGTSGRNEKIKILQSAKGDELWTEVLKFLFDPMVVTGISDAKLSKIVAPMTHRHYDLLGMLDYLRENNTGRDVDISVVHDTISSYPEHREWIGQLVTKSLKLGVDVSTINKVYGKGFIKVFAVMLAESFADYPNYLDGKKFIVTQKLDGLRCVAFVHNNGEAEFFTRNGQTYDQVPDVAADLLKIPARDVAYDGELIAVSNSTDCNEVFRETSSVARKDGVKTGLIYHVFDRVPLADFLDGYSAEPCIDRKRSLNTDIEYNRLTWVSAVRMLYVGYDQDQINELVKFAAEKKWEGLMLNDCEAPYKAKRVRDLLKVKKFKTVDVRVTGVYEGTGDNVGRLGGINTEFEIDGVMHKSNCGSGFSHRQREEYWEDPSKLIGKIVELKCFEVSTNRDGSRSLRFPVWLDIIRFDKDTTSVV